MRSAVNAFFSPPFRRSLHRVHVIEALDAQPRVDFHPPTRPRARTAQPDSARTAADARIHERRRSAPVRGSNHPLLAAVWVGSRRIRRAPPQSSTRSFRMTHTPFSWSHRSASLPARGGIRSNNRSFGMDKRDDFVAAPLARNLSRQLDADSAATDDEHARGRAQLLVRRVDMFSSLLGARDLAARGFWRAPDTSTLSPTPRDRRAISCRRSASRPSPRSPRRKSPAPPRSLARSREVALGPSTAPPRVRPSTAEHLGCTPNIPWRRRASRRTRPRVVAGETRADQRTVHR